VVQGFVEDALRLDSGSLLLAQSKEAICSCETVCQMVREATDELLVIIESLLPITGSHRGAGETRENRVILRALLRFPSTRLVVAPGD
jgi:hypothetical protein